MAKVSILLPVYNSEKYLSECLESIRCQTFEDYELICYDDGSSDGSAAILDEYAQNDSRCRVIHAENGGLPHARNTMLRLSSGDYIMYIDADDRYVPQTVESAYNRIFETGADITVFNAWDFEGVSGELINHQYIFKSILPKGCEAVSAKMNPVIDLFKFTSMVCWNKIYKKSLLTKQLVYFDEDLRSHTDVYFSAVTRLLADKITWTDKRLYRYRRSSMGSLKNINEGSLNAPLDSYVSAKNRLLEAGLLENKDHLRYFNLKAFSVFRFNIEFTDSYNTYVAMCKFMQEKGIKSLGLEQENQDYFSDEWDGKFFQHIKEGRWDDFLLELYKYNHIKLLKQEQLKSKAKQSEAKAKENESKAKENEAKAKHNEAEARENEAKAKRDLHKKTEELEKLKNSRSYKLGNAIAKPWRKVRKVFGI